MFISVVLVNLVLWQTNIYILFFIFISITENHFFKLVSVLINNMHILYYIE